MTQHRNSELGRLRAASDLSPLPNMQPGTAAGAMLKRLPTGATAAGDPSASFEAVPVNREAIRSGPRRSSSTISPPRDKMAQGKVCKPYATRDATTTGARRLANGGLPTPSALANISRDYGCRGGKNSGE